ncbi:MAG: hypothetical protein SO009_04020 [Bacilli bacterium]|nr:hypothetical protein [Bacilli bacterium]
MKKNDKILLIVFIAVFLLITAIGLSYAYYTAVIDNGEESSSIVSKSGSLELTYTDGVKQIIGADIYPGWQDTKTFTVKNTGSNVSAYSIRVTNIVNNFSIYGSISISIVGSNGGKSLSKRLIPASDSSIIDYVSIGEGVTHTYSITVYYNNLNVDQSPDKGKSFSFQVGIGEALGDGTEPNNWADAPSGTLLNGIKAKYPSPGITNMGSTPDDYGTSYYFRGNVQNNFVSFAGMCWRIVRITGDGSIKLALYDYSSASCTNNGNDLAFARYDGDTYATVFNKKSDDNAYIGFMYGTPNSDTYASTHANINKSTILQNLETWYKAKLTSYTDKLADTIWCNDKSTSGLGYQNNDSNYGAHVRFQHPSLICPNDNNGGKLSKFTVSDVVYGNGNLDYKIGLLTADEITLAETYLMSNATSGWYWTLSPYAFDGGGALVWYTSDDYGLVGVRVGASRNLRPVISLKFATMISGGNGTASNPFVIQ